MNGKAKPGDTAQSALHKQGNREGSSQYLCNRQQAEKVTPKFPWEGNSQNMAGCSELSPNFFYLRKMSNLV